MDVDGRHWRRRFTFVGVFLGLIARSLPAQIANRSVEVEAQHRNDAVAITRVTLGDTILECGLPSGDTTTGPVTPVAAGPDWLSKIRIFLLNRTDKAIVYGEIQLGFPETGDGKGPLTPMTIVPLRVGVFPPAVAFTGSGKPLPSESRPLLNLGADQTIELPVTADVYGDIHRNLAGRVSDPGAIAKLAVRRGSFIFSDNMKWNKGSFWLPDPERLGNWVQVADRRFFPGRPNWPPTFTK